MIKLNKATCKKAIGYYGGSIALASLSLVAVDYLGRELGEIEGLNAITLEQTSLLASEWLPKILVSSACMAVYHRLHVLQVALYAAAITLLAFIGADQYAQLLELEKMDLFSGDLIDMIHLNDNAKTLIKVLCLASVAWLIVLVQLVWSKPSFCFKQEESPSDA